MAAPGQRAVPGRFSARVLRGLRAGRPLWRFLYAFCRAVEGCGGKPYLVGGFVRDLVENRPGKDIDLMVAGMEFGNLGRLLRSLPARRLGIRRILPAGKTFAVYKIRAGWAEEDIDVALARPARHGLQRNIRTLDDDAREDAARRDFTINSLLFALRTARGTLTGSVIDFFGGIEDLRGKLIRGVEDPEDRIREDPLRLLRAIRLKNERQGYSIENDTWTAVRRAAPESVLGIPGERVAVELLRSLSANPQGTVEDLHRAGILAILLPEAVAVDPRGERSRRRYAILERSLGRPLPETPLLANLLVDAAQVECVRRIRSGFPSRLGPTPPLTKKDEDKLFRLPLTEAIARRLHLPRIRNVVRILEEVARLLNVARLRNRNARIEAIFGRCESPEELRSLYRACCETSGRKPLNFGPILGRAARRKPLLSGNDLLKLGILPGPAMEEILDEVREATIAGMVGNRKEGIALAASISAGRGSARTPGRVIPPARKATRPTGSRGGTG